MSSRSRFLHRKRVQRIYQAAVFNVGLLLAFLSLSSCANDMEKVDFFSKKDLPGEVIRNASISRTEKGVLQMRLTAPLIERYSSPQAKTLYPDGLFVRFYNEQGEITSSISARYGYSLDDRNIMEARDSVVIVDYRSGDTSYLEHIIWNSDENRVYSNRPVKSVNGQRVTYGDGFVSDENFTKPQILRQRGTIEFND